MGYRDDFYCADNILGYTGDISKPTTVTVYFADAGGVNPKLQTVNGAQKVVVSFGHITQVHDIAANVGREAVREAYSYSICNVMYEGKECAQECVYGEQELNKIGLVGYETESGKSRDEQHLDWHISRNRFESVSAGNRAILAAALGRCPDKKKL